MTQEEKLTYIEQYLDSNGKNELMGIERNGMAFTITGANSIMLMTGVGGCYNYIKAFHANIMRPVINRGGVLEQPAIKGEYKSISYKKLVEAVKEAFGYDKK